MANVFTRTIPGHWARRLLALFLCLFVGSIAGSLLLVDRLSSLRRKLYSRKRMREEEALALENVGADPMVPTGVSGASTHADGTIGEAIAFDHVDLNSETTDAERKRGMMVLFLALIVNIIEPDT